MRSSLRYFPIGRASIAVLVRLAMGLAPAMFAAAPRRRKHFPKHLAEPLASLDCLYADQMFRAYSVVTHGH